MHAIKGGWVGQTFALSKSHESDGKKSRIRRSKEERKAMVESFIQKYQKLNNGSFPSLNLTHKEVGGSFYTVREIVRDVIQENRVLGPAKFTEENQITYKLEQNPLGSIALEPPFPVLSNGSQLVEHEYQSSGEELSLTSESHHASLEHLILDNGKVTGFLLDLEEKGVEELSYVEIKDSTEVIEQSGGGDSDKNHDIVSTEREIVDNRISIIINESHDVVQKEYQEIHQTNLKVNEESKYENVEEELAVSRSQATTPFGDIKVETFPMRTVDFENDSAWRSNEVVGGSHVEIVNSRIVDGIEVTKLPNAISDNDFGLSSEASSDYLSSATTVFEQSNGVAGAKNVNDSNGMKTKNVDRSGDSTNRQLKTEKEVDVQPQKEINASLDRINLESWDGGAKNPGNPLLAIFKAFLNAVMKFWSE